MGLGSQITKIVISIGVADIDRALFQRLTWLVVVLAGIGVFATLLTQAREKVRDLGILKALGMTPRQVITMVTCWAIAPAIIAAAIALPAGTALEPVVARAIVSAQAGPAQNFAPLVRPSPGGAAGNARLPRQQPPAAPGGIVRYTRHGRAVINAPPHRQPGSGQQSGPHPFSGLLGPAVWAAAARTTTALRAE